MASQCEVRPIQGFDVILNSPRSEAATMVLEPGEKTGGPNNKHVGSDQWLFVTEGEGYVVVSGKKHTLSPSTLLLIEAGENHEVHCTGDQSLKTLNIYAPPEYS